MATINLRNVPGELHRAAKIEAIKADMTLTAWIIEAIQEKLARDAESK